MSKTVEFRIRENLDIEALAREYAANKQVQIPNFFPEDTAMALFETLLRETPWRLSYADRDGRTIMLSTEQLKAMSPQQLTDLQAEVGALARENHGFLYYVYPMIDAYTNKWDPGHPLHYVTEFVNTPDFLELGRRIIGTEKITRANAQATYYAPGHFLTRHVDDGERKERRCAYTIGFSANWEPDWGGLTMFLDDKQDIESALVPRFNTLTLFDGWRIHAVSSVAPFVQMPRFCITGWLQDDPLPGQVQ